MKILKTLSIAFVALLTITSCSSDDDNNTVNTTNYTATLSALNDSGAAGNATVAVDGNTLTVVVDASGMVANQAHPQHIHGLEDGSNGVCPPSSADTDGDGIISVPEGAPFYGAILLPLKNFPMADADGNVSYTKTFTLGEDGLPTAEELGTIENRVIVLHGLNNDGEYVATIPVACGQLAKS